MGESTDLDLREQLARIDRAISENAKLQEETTKLRFEGLKLQNETAKLHHEGAKLQNEAAAVLVSTFKMRRDNLLAPIAVAIAFLTALASILGQFLHRGHP